MAQFTAQPDWLEGLSGELAQLVELDFLPVCNSTNSLLKERITQAARPEELRPRVLITDQQQQGRGTRGRAWLQVASSGGHDIALSLACRQRGELLDDPRLSLLTGALVLNGLSAWAEAELPALADSLAVKWPNDILGQTRSGWRKLGGILIESCLDARRERWLVVGVGLNINSCLEQFPAELQPAATSLRELSREPGQKAQPLDRDGLLRQLVALLVRGLLNPDADRTRLLDSWFSAERTAGTEYLLQRDGESRRVVAVGVERASGQLRVCDQQGVEYLVSSYTELSQPQP